MLALLALLACGSDDQDGDGVPSLEDCDDLDPSLGDFRQDHDCDGYLVDEDCDDTDQAVNPGSSEVWGDGVDNDCDGLVDLAERSCSSEIVFTSDSGASGTPDLCAVHSWDPGHQFWDTELPELKGFVVSLNEQESATVCGLELQLSDVCGEGYYELDAVSVAAQACSGVDDSLSFEASGWLRLDTIHVDEVKGQFVDEELGSGVEASLFLEGAGWTLEGSFAVGSRHNGRPESGDCVTHPGDQDEDGYLDAALGGEDCDDLDPLTAPGIAHRDSDSACMKDHDGDGYGDADPDNGAEPGTDCLDTEDAVYTGAALEEPGICTVDADGDGWGDLLAEAPLDAGSDCNDADAEEYPGAVDEAADSLECMLDADGDGYGDMGAGHPYDKGSDCDDSDPFVKPGAVREAEADECMIDLDEDGYGDATATHPYDPGTDCDDSRDDVYTGAASAEPELCTEDGDGDGWGDADAVSPLEAGTDCRDDMSSVKPGAASAEPDLCTLDSDGDGYGPVCQGTVSGIDAGTDCDDSDGAVYPGAVAEATGGECMEDLDGDGYGSDRPTDSCYDAGTDCWDDASDADAAATWPGAAYEDSTTACSTDADGDGWGTDDPSSNVTAGTDCDDSSSSVYPDALGIDEMDGSDLNCDGEDNFNYPDEQDFGSSHAPSTAYHWYAGDHLATGDVDGDGLPDLYVRGDSTEDTSWILTGPVSAWDSDLLAAPIDIAVGDDGYGDLGDLDGDGVVDLVHWTHDGAGRLGSVWLGPLSGNLTAAGADFEITETGSDGPCAVDGAADLNGFVLGDLDADGQDELVLGAPDCGTTNWYQGALYVFQGPLSGDVDTEDAAMALGGEDYYDWEGLFPEVVQDVNGDGQDELLSSSWGDYEVRLFSDPLNFTGSDVDDADWISSKQFTRAVSGGDTNGDGYGDVFGGTEGDGVFLYLGDSSGLDTSYVFEMDDYESYTLGGPPFAAGDFDGDGTSDVGVSGYETHAVYIQYGPMSGFLRDYQADVVFEWDGNENENPGGSSYSKGMLFSDLDGDGDDDMVTGHPYSYITKAGNSFNVGGVWVTSY